MASLRRNKALLPDSLTARFLYTILKQLDLKAIDWNLVAESLDITNGHAARMRYSRFKQQIEGMTTPSKSPRAVAKKKGKEDKEGLEAPKRGKKRELDADLGNKVINTALPLLKNEDMQPGVLSKRIKCEDGRHVKQEQDIHASDVLGFQSNIKPNRGLLDQAEVANVTASSQVSPLMVPAPRIKREPQTDKLNDDVETNPDIWRILPRNPATAGAGKAPVAKTNCLQDRTRRPIPIHTRFAPAVAAVQHHHHHNPAAFYPLSSSTGSIHDTKDNGNGRNEHHATCRPPTTVSLSDLEVSPRSQPAAIAPPAITTANHRAGNPICHCGGRHHHHQTHCQSITAPATTQNPRARNGETDGHDTTVFRAIDWGTAQERGPMATTITQPPVAGVKSEPLEI